MWANLLIILQVFKVFLDLWKEKDDKKAEQQADTAKEIVDAFAAADPKDRASKLNADITDIRLRS